MEIKLALPYVNLNGNDQETLNNELAEVIRDAQNLQERVARLQYSHGRNSICGDHANEMRKDKQMMVEKVAEIKTVFTNLYKGMNAKCEA